MENFIKRLESIPPTCLRELACVSAKLPEPWDDNAKSVWQIRCKCGGNTGRVLGHSLQDYNKNYRGPLQLISPLAFQCSACNRTTEFLDTDIHGYHADIQLREGDGNGSTKWRGTGDRMAYPCPNCAADQFSIALGFVFWNAEELEEEFDERWEDLFNVFLCYTTCAQCSELSRPTDFGKL